MVFLNRIYTKGGDGGETSLGNGSRVSKTDLRIIAFGGVDELNSVIGVALAHGLPEGFESQLKRIQNDLFDIGADLCVPASDDNQSRLRVAASQVAVLELWIDEINELLQPLTSFVLPGGSMGSAHLHQARSVCRRIEIGIVALIAAEAVNPLVLEYINRLSDLLFVMARACNNNGDADVLWEPGAGQ